MPTCTDKSVMFSTEVGDELPANYDKDDKHALGLAADLRRLFQSWR